MKVSDLIHRLSGYNPNDEVIVEVADAGEYMDLESVRSYSETGVHIIVNQRNIDE